MIGTAIDPDARRHVLPTDGVLAVTHLDKITAQTIRLVHRVSRRPRQWFGEIPLDEVRRLVSEKDFSHASRVQRQMTAGATHSRDTPLPHQALHLERLTDVEHRERDAHAGLLIQSRQRGQRALAESVTQGRVLRNPSERRPNPIASVGPTVKESSSN